MTQTTPTPELIDKFIAFTKVKGWDIDSYQIADSLWWYALTQAEEGEALPPTPPSTPEPRQPSSETLGGDEGKTEAQESETPSDKVPLIRETEAQTHPEKIQADTLPVSLPDAKFWRETLKLSRAVRPLIQKIDSATQKQLDLSNTVQRSAEYSLGRPEGGLALIPAYKAKKVRSLEVILLIEEWASMVFWKQLAGEIRDWLEQIGAFRDVKLYRMGWDEEKQKLAIRPYSNDICLNHPKDLIHPRGERLILFYSDCTSPDWYRGRYNEALQEWGKHQIVTLLSPFPEAIWERTALSRGWQVSLANETPRSPSQNWKMTSIPLLLQIHLEENKPPLREQVQEKYFPLPIIYLTASSLGAWALVLSGNSSATCGGVLLEKNPQDMEIPSAIPAAMDSRQALELFASTASPLAWELLKKLAATPVNLPVMRLIQTKLLPASNPLHIAEIILSGFLQVTIAGEEVKWGKGNKFNFHTPPNSLDFEFMPDVRDTLLDELGESRALEVISVLSEYIAQKLNLSTTTFFGLILTNSQALLGKEAGNLVRAFAFVSAQVFRKLGEDKYQQIAEKLEAATQATSTPVEIKDDWQRKYKTVEIAKVKVLTGGEEILWQLLKERLKDFSIEDGELYEHLHLTPEQLNLLGQEGITPEAVKAQFGEVLDSTEEEVITQKFNLSLFKSETIFVDDRGQITARRPVRAYYRQEEPPGLTMLYIPSGEFWMGTQEEEIERLVKKFNWDGYRRESPRHLVKIAPFYLSQTPITQAQWQFIAQREDLKEKLDLEPDPSNFKGSNRPVEQVSWLEAVEFCQRLSKMTRRKYRLPSEAEWEYACRAGTTTPYHFGETLTSTIANYYASSTYADEPSGEYRQETTPVGQFPTNAFGLYDMHGNVWEWCEDDWHENYKGAPTDGSAWRKRSKKDQNQANKAMRGGSWLSLPDLCRSAYRNIVRREDRNYDLISYGFRVVCEVKKSEV